MAGKRNTGTEWSAELNEQERNVVEHIINKGERTYQSIADEMGVSLRQLTRIKGRPHVRRAIRELATQETAEDLPQVLKNLAIQASKPDASAKVIEVYLKASGVIMERQEIEQTVKNEKEGSDYGHYSDEELENELSDFQKRMQEKQKKDA